MKHPTSEEWMAFLYDETEPARHAELRAHAQECPECAIRLGAWTGGRQSLDAWPVTLSPCRRTARLRLLKLAGAAVLMLGVGLAIGRSLQRPSADLAGFKAEILKEFDRRVSATVASSGAEVRRTLAEFAQGNDDRRTLDRDAVISALRQLDARYSAVLTALRLELETVALNTEDGLIETHQKLGLLASSTQPTKGRSQ